MPKPDTDWSLKLTRARDALALLSSTYPGDSWGDINVAHLDTGIRPNSAFGAWVTPLQGVNFVEPGQSPYDPLHPTQFAGHGTRTLSVLTGLRPGFQGVAAGLPAIPYRVADDVLLGTKTEQNNVARAITHAVEERACEVITISMGYPLNSLFTHSALGAAVDLAYRRGVIVVAAGGQVINQPCYPGKFFRAIAVGGLRKGDSGDLGIYQDYFDGNPKQSLRTFIDVWAPADPVWRIETPPTVTPGVDFPAGWGDGTSYATPHVAAGAAMWLSYRRNEIAAAYTAPWQRVEAFRLLLKQTAIDLSGRPDFKGTKPHRGTTPPQKGAVGKNRLGATGGLDILALLQADLPKAGVLREETRLAENQRF
jgi:subtilisin family serine protease